MGIKTASEILSRPEMEVGSWEFGKEAKFLKQNSKRSPGNEFPGSITEVPAGLQWQSEASGGPLYFSLIF